MTNLVGAEVTNDLGLTQHNGSAESLMGGGADLGRPRRAVSEPPEGEGPQQRVVPRGEALPLIHLQVHRPLVGRGGGRTGGRGRTLGDGWNGRRSNKSIRQQTHTI